MQNVTLVAKKDSLTVTDYSQLPLGVYAGLYQYDIKVFAILLNNNMIKVYSLSTGMLLGSLTSSTAHERLILTKKVSEEDCQ